MIKACIFDLDGVLVDTAKYHFLSWKKLANKLDFILEKEIEEKIKGISRMDSLEIILKHAGIDASFEEKKEYAALKNTWFLDSISEMKKNETLPGVNKMLNTLKNNNIKIAVASSSKNATNILDQISLLDCFEIVYDGNMVEKTKPNPEIFLKVSAALQLEPYECLVFEDAVEGIKAANEGGFRVVGIGNKKILKEAEHVEKGFENLDILLLIDILSKNENYNHSKS